MEKARHSLSGPREQEAIARAGAIVRAGARVLRCVRAARGRHRTATRANGCPWDTVQRGQGSECTNAVQQELASLTQSGPACLEYEVLNEKSKAQRLKEHAARRAAVENARPDRAGRRSRGCASPAGYRAASAHSARFVN